MARNLPVAFMAIIAGGVLLDAGIKGASIGDVIKGQAVFANPSTGSGSGGAGATVTGGGGVSGGTNPFPGGFTPSRLDMGMDGTFKNQIVSPVSGKVVYSTASDPGWEGGGYVAVQSASKIPGLPSRTIYFAEGLIPTVKVGDVVQAGQQIARPVASPYNSIVGNIEWGMASDSNPGDPLAHTIANPAQMVLAFSHWAQHALGVGPPTSTDHAGYS